MKKRFFLLLAALMVVFIGCSLNQSNQHSYVDPDDGPVITVILQNDTIGYKKAGFFAIESIENRDDTFILYKEMPIVNEQFSFHLPTYQPLHPLFSLTSMYGDSVVEKIAVRMLNLYDDNCVDTVQESGNNGPYLRYYPLGWRKQYAVFRPFIACDTSNSNWFFYINGIYDSAYYNDTTVILDIENY